VVRVYVGYGVFPWNKAPDPYLQGVAGLGPVDVKGPRKGVDGAIRRMTRAETSSIVKNMAVHLRRKDSVWCEYSIFLREHVREVRDRDTGGTKSVPCLQEGENL
jgi:hypothetical protein